MKKHILVGLSLFVLVISSIEVKPPGRPDKG